jgi:hypothetical protein
MSLADEVVCTKTEFRCEVLTTQQPEWGLRHQVLVTDSVLLSFRFYTTDCGAGSAAARSRLCSFLVKKIAIESARPPRSS